MTSPGMCPFCGSTKLVPAELHVTDGNSARPYLHFPQVKAFPWWKLSSSDPFDRQLRIQPPTVCLGCGTLWAKYDLPAARHIIEHEGSDDFKALLAKSDAKASPPKSA